MPRDAGRRRFEGQSAAGDRHEEMKKQRILLVMQGPPLPFGTGAMGKWYYVLLKGLVERGHRVAAFATCTTADEVERSQVLFPLPKYNLQCYMPEPVRGLKAKWATVWRPYSAPLTAQLKRDLRDQAQRGFDLLHLEVLWSGWVGRGYEDRTVINVPFLYQIDLADQPIESGRDWLLRRRAFSAERALLRRYQNIVAVSPRLAKHIRQVAPQTIVNAIPFGLDISLYPFFETITSDARRPTLGMVAAFHWTPGYTAGMRVLTRLWPEIKRRVPDAQLKLAGIYGKTAFRDFLDLPDVEITDHVSDVQAFFRKIDLQLYAPNPSSGMKFKVLESFAYGIPVVTNAAGVEGIPAEDGIHAGICEDDAGLIERTVALLSDPQRRERQRRAARTLLEGHCDPNSVLNQLEQIYARIA